VKAEQIQQGTLQTESRMKYVCLGFFDAAAFAQIPQADAQRMMEECFAYDDVLRRGGHFLGGEALDSAHNAITLRMKDGEVQVAGSTYVETKETLGGFLPLEARDLNHAIALLSKHPALKIGNVFFLRPEDAPQRRRLGGRLLWREAPRRSEGQLHSHRVRPRLLQSRMR
jgi:hypothetical protein